MTPNGAMATSILGVINNANAMNYFQRNVKVVSVEHLGGGGGPRAPSQPPLQQHPGAVLCSPPQSALHQHPGSGIHSSDDFVLPPKRQAVVDRLRRRIETYRRRQTECVPRFDQSFNGACEQQNLETSVLQKRFLEGKAKRVPKKNSGGGSQGLPPQIDRKPDTTTINGNLHSSVHVQQKFNTGDYEQQPKMTCGNGGAGASSNEGLTKFSVEIVQQLEFTTSAADSQPQQISTNVTVKALTNSTTQHPQHQQPPQNETETKASPRPQSPLEFKRECKDEIVEDEFPGLADLIGEDEGDEIMASAAFADLITELHDYPELMKDFDFDTGRNVENDTKLELSPAAQTLKQMAEQHQYKSAADWRYRPYRPRATLDQIVHASQQQQMHLGGQPLHNIQVSAGQHMMMNGDTRQVTAQQGMYANFAHHHPLGGANACDNYSMSQTQTMSFNQEGMRVRAPGQQPPNGPLAAAGLTREHHAKMLQQQQQMLLRQQQRPPPPDYRTSPAACRRLAPPNMRHPGVFGLGNAVTLQQQQQQQLRAHHYMHHHTNRGGNQQHQPQQMSPMTHLTLQQNQMMNAHGQLSNIHMAQSQSISLHQNHAQASNMHHHQQQPTNHSQPPTSHASASTNQNHGMNSMHAAFPSFPTGAEFNLDFLDNMQPSDELLSNLDNSFLNDIL